MSGEPADAFEQNPEILSESMVAYPDLEPVVVVRWGEMAGQLPPDDARKLGLQMIEAAEAAEHDSAMCRFFMEALDLDIEKTMVILGQQREFRGTRR